MAVADAVKEAGTISQGALYSAVAGVLDLCSFQTIVKILTKAHAVEETSDHRLRWIGGQS